MFGGKEGEGGLITLIQDYGVVAISFHFSVWISTIAAVYTAISLPGADELIATLGGPAAIHRWLRGHGLEGIRVDRDIADLLAARRDLWDVRDSSTPLAMLELLRLIDGDRALSAQSRATLMDMMRRCATGSNRIRGLMPPGTVVEHKTGTLNRYTTDVGFVTLPDGRRLAVAFFARGGDNRPAVIATAARAIYDGFAPRLAAANPAPGTVQTTLQGGGRALLSAEY